MSHAQRWHSPAFILTVGALTVAAAVAAGVLAMLWPGTEAKRLTAYFERTVGLSTASHVRVLGVRVGEVTEVVPAGDRVRVEMVYGGEYRLPADVKAVILNPGLASDRYVQLTPVYGGGPVLEEGGVLPPSSTAVPVEIDEIFASIDDLSVALGPGPDGANRRGSLSRLLTVGADNLSGQGENLRETTENLAEAAGTLSGGRDDLFSTVRNLQEFTTALAESDRQMQAFNEDLAEVSTQLDAERDDLAAALENLSLALAEVTEFVRANRGELTANVQDLTTLSDVLIRQQDDLAEFLDTAPLALSNAWNSFEPTSQTLAFRMNPGQTQDPAMFLCSLLYSLDVPPTECEPLLAPLDRLAQDTVPVGLDPSVIPLLAGNPDIRPPPPDARNGERRTQRDHRYPAATPGTSNPDPTLGGVLPG